MTIAEFARVRGVTPAAVYKRLNTVYKEYATVYNGKKMLLSSILSEFPPVGAGGGGNQQAATVDDSIQSLKTVVDALTEQLKVKDQQIAALSAALAAAQQSIQAEQAMRAGAIQKRRLLPFFHRREKEDQ